MAQKLYETGDIWSESVRLLLVSRGTLLAFLVFMTITEVITGRFPDSAVADVAGSLVALVLGFWLIISMLHFGGIAPEGVLGDFWTFFGAALLFSLAVTAGFFAFVFPAFYIGLRLIPVFGFALVSDDGLQPAFIKAWHATRGHFWEIAGAMFIPMVIGIVGFAIVESWAVEGQPLAIIPSIAYAFTIAAGSASIIAIGIGVYASARNKV